MVIQACANIKGTKCYVVYGPTYNKYVKKLGCVYLVEGLPCQLGEYVLDYEKNTWNIRVLLFRMLITDTF